MTTDIARVYSERANTPSDIFQHLPTLRNYARMSQSIAELGSAHCNSTWALLAGYPKKMRCYDVKRYEPHFSEVELAAGLAGIDFKFLIQSSTAAVIEPCDLLFIDSAHYCDHCSLELSMHHAQVSGWIIFHDTSEFGFTDENRQGRGLVPAIWAFLAQNPQWKILEVYHNCNGLTVLGRTQSA